MDISISKLPWYGQIAAFVLLAIAGVGVYYYYFEIPLKADIVARELQLTALRADIDKGLTTARKLPEFQSQVGELEGRLESLRAVLPEEKDAADLLRRMQTVATQSNLTITGFRPATVVTKQLHAEWPITLEVNGTYHNLAIFLDRLGKFTRIINVSGLNVRALDKKDPNATISATCVATTFVLLDRPGVPKGSPAPAAAPAKKVA